MAHSLESPEAVDLEQRLAYLELGEADREVLAALAPVLERDAEGLVAAFYRHLLSFGYTRMLLADPEVKARLFEQQRAYVLSLANPAFDSRFLADRRRIGAVHEHIGLEPRWYLGAYAHLFSLIVPLVCEAFHDDSDRVSRTLGALQKLLMFDAQLAMESYVEAKQRQLEYLTQELAEHSRLLGREFDAQSATLRRTQEQARIAEELASIATLVTGLAHEIGTPMGVIQGHAKMLESAVSGEDATWRLRTIQEQIGRISRIIQTLLGMARPHAPKRQPVALDALLETTLSFVAEKLARRGIEVKRTIGSVPSVTGDPERLQQLLLNLVLNAADAMPDGGELRLALALSGDQAVEILVADTGAGIAEGDLARVFEPFFTTKAAGEGSGLGLMVCKGIVGDHGGSIDVESRQGEGTEFSIRLPVAAAQGA